MQQLSRDLVEGSVDLHTHGFPEVHPGLGMALDDFEQAEYAKLRGMAGYVLKSHLWPTMDRVYHIRQRVEGIKVVSAIVLNLLVGGIQPSVVETAIIQGAGAVFFPTWSSANDLHNGGFSRFLRRELPSLEAFMTHGLSVLDDTGELTMNARDVLKVAKEHEILVCTGHLSGKEGVALAREADHIGFRRLLLSHPDSRSVGATDEEILEAAKCGAFIEWTFNGMLPHSQRISPQKVIEWIEKIGKENCVLTTDTFGRASMPEPDNFQMYLGVLNQLGVEPDAIKLMSSGNPKELLSGSINWDF